MSKSIALITASVRTPRAGDTIAAWVSSVLDTRPSDDLTIKPLSIASFNLPVFDEPIMPAFVPARGSFTHEHSKRWSAAIAAFAGYIFVVPEYNAGLPGGVKNAIDYLKNEWPGKPVAIVSYGIQGGSEANAQLALSLGRVMEMVVVEPRVLLPFAHLQDTLKAADEGVIGEETKTKWEEKRGEIIEAVGEIGRVLKEGPGKKEEEAKKVATEGSREERVEHGTNAEA